MSAPNIAQDTFMTKKFIVYLKFKFNWVLTYDLPTQTRQGLVGQF